MFKMGIRYVYMLMAGLCVYACSPTEQDETLRVELARKDFVFSVVTEGELVAAKEVPINAPVGNRGNLTLSWFEEENKQVKAGDVVARFDDSEHVLNKTRSELELQKNLITKNISTRDLSHKQFVVEQLSGEVDDELHMVEKFNLDGLEAYSKLEIIDQLLVKEYLTAHQNFLGWRLDSQKTQGEAQFKLLDLQGKTHRDAISLSTEALANLEVRAPVDGMLIYAKNWSGEKVREGQSLWPGSKLGAIPQLDQLNAKLNVFENEAAGIAIGQDVKVWLDAYPDNILNGKVKSMANIATPISRSNPSKYFEVIVSLDTPDAAFMHPGQKLSGEIFVAQKPQVLSVPNQAVFKDDTQAWVYVKVGKAFKKRVVTTGLRSLTQTEILEGLSVGDEVALLEPIGNTP